MASQSALPVAKQLGFGVRGGDVGWLYVLGHELGLKKLNFNKGLITLYRDITLQAVKKFATDFLLHVHLTYSSSSIVF